jgi:hypothetical protein
MPRRTLLRSHNRQRASRKPSAHAAALCSPCANHVPHCTAQAQRTEAAAYATLARFSLKVFLALKRRLGQKEAAVCATLERSPTRIT